MNKTQKLTRAKKHLAEQKIDGWLLYDFHKSNDLAHRFLEFSPHAKATRRFFYWIPVDGEPIKIVHAIEPHVLDGWPGERRLYASWQSLEEILQSVLKGKKKIAMEYSPRGEIPYVSKVDGGTIDCIRSLGVEVASSAEFLLHFTSVLTPEQILTQKRAARTLLEIVEGAWEQIEQALLEGLPITEREVQKWIEERIGDRRLVMDGAPIVAVGPHSADPHFSTPKEGSSPIRRGDWVLIDLWAKEKAEGAIFGDLTRVAVADHAPTAQQQHIFDVVRGAQKRAIELVRSRFAAGRRLEGWEVDEAARSYVRSEGYGDYFIHRTGHNIEVELHGSGTHMDNLEMHDTRPILPMTCFSIEPGIYLTGEFGVRLETDLIIEADRSVVVSAGEEDVVRCLLK